MKKLLELIIELVIDKSFLKPLPELFNKENKSHFRLHLLHKGKKWNHSNLKSHLNKEVQITSISKKQIFGIER